MFGRRNTPKLQPELKTREGHFSWAEAARDLALFRADMLGLQESLGQFSNFGRLRVTRREREFVRDVIEQHTLPYLILDPRPGLHIVDVNQAFAATTSTTRNRLAGDKLFDRFPDNPSHPEAEGVSNIFEFLRKSAQAGQPATIASQRYDIRDSRGQFIERHWRVLSTPVFDEVGRLIYLLFQPVELQVR